MDEMLDAYIVAALWSSNDESDESGGDPIDDNYGRDDLHPDALAAMTADVKKFLEENAADIGDRYGDAGHDFWLTRNRHGCGFWETTDWPAEVGQRLMEACRKFGERNLYIDNGKVCQEQA